MKKTTARDADHRPCLLKHCAGKDYYCSLELTLQVIGGKWKPIILWRIGQDGVLRFSELRRILPNITQKMLTQQLRELEGDGLVKRTVWPQVPPKVEYELTGLGTSVVPVLRQLCAWGSAYEERFGEPAAASSGPEAASAGASEQAALS